jgi:hypothetical protein
MPRRFPSADKTPATTPADRSKNELRALLQELRTLEQEGKLDATAEAHIRTRFSALAQRVTQEHEHLKARLERDRPLPPAKFQWWPPPGRERRLTQLLLAGVALFLAGPIMALMLGGNIIFVRGPAYRVAMPYIFCVSMPVLWAAQIKFDKRLPGKHPRWGRCLMRYPFNAMLVAGLIVLTPYGWAALFGHVFGSPGRYEVTVKWVDGLKAPGRRPSWSCRQHGTLEFRGASAKVCMQRAFVGPMPHTGDTVEVNGRLSWWGLVVDPAEHR